MKNYRGTALSNVRNAMWKVFGVEKLPPLRSNASAADVIKWKQSQPVIDTFNSLFEKNSDDVFWITAIARAAFTEAESQTLLTLTVPLLSRCATFSSTHNPKELFARRNVLNEE